jgi:uncharacterized protein YndB with AHSA1/START domain
MKIAFQISNKKTEYMLKLDFKIQITASASKVWQVLWNDLTYRKWAAVFREGSYAVTDWQTGSKAHFLTPGGDGIYSLICENRPKEYMEIEHLGEIKDFKEQVQTDEQKSWMGSKEIYSLVEVNGETTLSVSLQSVEDFAEYFSKTFPKALNKIKEIAERPLELIVETLIEASLENVWRNWTGPEHIAKWNFASDDWHCPKAENDLKEGGKFVYTMAAKDGSFSFDFWGIYDKVDPFKTIISALGDNRKMKVEFVKENNFVRVIETFEAETENPLEMQQLGWQSILNNFKKYVESNK